MNELENLPGIDAAAGLKTAMNNEALYRRLLVKFRDGQQGFAGELRAAQAAGDKEGMQQISHSLKGVSGNLGMSQLYHASMALNDACKAHADDLEGLIQETVQQLQVVLDGLAGLAAQ